MITLNKPSPVSDCECSERQVIETPAIRPSVCKKDMNGSFKVTGGSLKGGSVRLAYIKDGFSRPAYHLTASRDADGVWAVTHCDCLGHEHAGHCKHALRAALALPTWPSEDCELMRLLLGDDGRRALCPFCETGTMMSVNWRRPDWMTLITWACDNPDCGRRVIL